jgi:CDP-diacylglycerol--glycerol-3-phosphate 3-phosphatidyltransferase
MERLPNWLTWARLVAVPIVMALLAVDDGEKGSARFWALLVFVAASLTDFLDGFLARRWHVITSFGKLADPIADKALVLGTLLMLCITDGVPWWPFAILLVREVAVTVGRFRVVHTAVIPASRGGKVKTVLQLVAIGLYLLPISDGAHLTVAWWLLVASVVVAVVTWIDYEARLARARRDAASTADAA